jgi:hypothetical protein
VSDRLELILRRRPSTTKCTIGEIYKEDGEFVCFSLEDVVREMPHVPVSQWKIPGETAIPQGRYRITVTHSDRFGKALPLLNMVPGFGGIRIHPGNTNADTSGCILPGNFVNNDGESISDSRGAFAKLNGIIDEALQAGDDVYIQVRNADAAATA